MNVGGGDNSVGMVVCDRLTHGIHAARQGLGLEQMTTGQGLGNDNQDRHGDTAAAITASTGVPASASTSATSTAGVPAPASASATVPQSLRYLKEAFSALCKLGAGTFSATIRL